MGQQKVNNSTSQIFLLAVFLLNAQGFAQNPVDVCLSEFAYARSEVIETKILRIEKINLDPACPGKNKFTAVIKNRTNSPLKIGLDLRADPGLWFRKWQNRFLFELKPLEEKRIAANYKFSRMTSDAWLRVRTGFTNLRTEEQYQVFLTLCKFCFTLVLDKLFIDSYELKR